jgi:glutamyl-tRNA synthetase
MEDTDIERSEAAFDASIREDLRWLSLDWDEGPYRQSDRLGIYSTHARMLLEKGLAYKCFCSKEELEKSREDALRRGRPPRYSGVCRALSREALRELEAAGKPRVLRFKSLERKIEFRDGIHGEMTFPADHVDDFIIIRTDGIPSYNFAAVVDDLLMGITHVIRGSDHLSNTPKQIMLFLAFGKEPPAYAHHSLLIGPDKKPLSKRHGATRVAEFRRMGIVPEAMTNYLAIIGRKIGKELLSRDELIEDFSLRSFSASDALFDPEKLLWLNKEHLRNLGADDLLARTGLPEHERERVFLLRENARTLEEIRSMLPMFEDPEIDQEAIDLLLSMKEGGQTRPLLKEMRAADGGLEDLFKRLEEKSTLSRRDLFMFIRIVISGKKSGPPLKDLYRMMPKQTILKRIACLEEKLSTIYGT